jgi:hypothetical protein
LIINAVCNFYNVSRDELYRSRRGQFNEPGNVAIFLTRKLRRDSLKEIGHQFHMEKYSSISSIIERMKKQMVADRNLKKRVDRVADGVSKSQEQTPYLTPYSKKYSQKYSPRLYFFFFKTVPSVHCKHEKSLIT